MNKLHKRQSKQIKSKSQRGARQKIMHRSLADRQALMHGHFTTGGNKVLHKVKKKQGAREGGESKKRLHTLKQDSPS